MSQFKEPDPLEPNPAFEAAVKLASILLDSRGRQAALLGMAIYDAALRMLKTGEYLPLECRKVKSERPM